MLAATRDALAGARLGRGATRGAAARAGGDRGAIGAGKLFQPLRVALTGSTASPGIFDVLVLLGRDGRSRASTRPCAICSERSTILVLAMHLLRVTVRLYIGSDTAGPTEPGIT